MTPQEQIDRWYDGCKPRLIPGTRQETSHRIDELLRPLRVKEAEDWESQQPPLDGSSPRNPQCMS